jgi:2-methylisocitrate lyase-like PEP mutase family enzyme
MTNGLAPRCERLRSLHVPGTPLILPNAWDVPSARAVADAGFPVVATSSAAVAAAIGFEDHEAAPAMEMLGAAARICRAVDVPVTVDFEAGYGMAPAQLVGALQGVGAAGCNLEDTDHGDETLRDPSRHAAWLREVRAAATNAGYELVINARIDVWLTGGGDRSREDRLADGLDRAHAYLDAGADCVYPIALADPDDIAAFVLDAGGPVNILAYRQAPPIDELARLGVARISHGGLVFRRTMEGLSEILREIKETT